jgi:hypothetical protein
MPTTQRVEPGDFVTVPDHIEDQELLELAFTETDIKRLRNGEFVAGSLLTQGVGSGGGGRRRARGMIPGGPRTPTWKLNHDRGVLIIPEHFLVVSKGPKLEPRSAPPVGDECWTLEDMLDTMLGEYPLDMDDLLPD